MSPEGLRTKQSNAMKEETQRLEEKKKHCKHVSFFVGEFGPVTPSAG